MCQCCFSELSFLSFLSIEWVQDLKVILDASVKVPGYVLCKQNIQKQSPKVFHKKGTANYFVKLTGKHLFGNFFFNEITGMRSTTLLKRDCYTVYEIVKNTFIWNRSGGCF